MLRLDGSAIPATHARGIIALGNFDGFHLGHQAVLGAARDLARAGRRPLLAGTFDPHPVRLFSPAAPPMALTTLDQRLELLEAFGVDAAIVWRFDAAFAAITATDYIDELLARRLRVAGVVTGWDFTFGRGRQGTVATLARATAFTADAIPPVALDGPPVSSTRVRAALRDADPQAAARLLTRPFAIRARVIPGARLGRELGFPTANMALGDYVRPAYGVYAVRARLPGGTLHDGVANLGVRPMIEPPLELLETHLLDYAGDLYGQTLDIELHHFLRPEWKLDSLAALKAQVEADKAQARARLARSRSA